MRLIWVCGAMPLNFLSHSTHICIDLRLERMDDFLSSAQRSKLKSSPRTPLKRSHSFAYATRTVMMSATRVQINGRSKLLTTPQSRPLSKNEAIGASRWISARVPRVAARYSPEARPTSSASRVHTHSTLRAHSMARAQRVLRLAPICKTIRNSLSSSVRRASGVDS